MKQFSHLFFIYFTSPICRRTHGGCGIEFNQGLLSSLLVIFCALFYANDKKVSTIFTPCKTIKCAKVMSYCKDVASKKKTKNSLWEKYIHMMWGNFTFDLLFNTSFLPLQPFKESFHINFQYLIMRVLLYWMRCELWANRERDIDGTTYCDLNWSKKDTKG